eukprot:g13925.t1
MSSEDSGTETSDLRQYPLVLLACSCGVLALLGGKSLDALQRYDRRSDFNSQWSRVGAAPKDDYVVVFDDKEVINNGAGTSDAAGSSRHEQEDQPLRLGLAALGLEGCFQLIPDFVSEKEEAELLEAIDVRSRPSARTQTLSANPNPSSSGSSSSSSSSSSFPWCPSQSGRQKADFGPKINYKQQKWSLRSFRCLPERVRDTAALAKLRDFCAHEAPRGSNSSPEATSTWSALVASLPDTNVADHLHDPARSLAILQQRTQIPYPTLEQLAARPLVPAGWFFQRYEEGKLAHFDPHIDHAWIWGDRILDLNLLSDSVLSFFSPLQPTGDHHEQGGSSPVVQKVRVDVLLPRRSLLVFAGNARHRWEHAVLPRTYDKERVSLTVRELVPEFLHSQPGELCARLANECTAEDQELCRNSLKKLVDCSTSGGGGAVALRGGG